MNFQETQFCKLVFMESVRQPLWQNSARTIATAVCSGQISAFEVSESTIARIESVNPRINAITQSYFEDAAQQAQQIDADPKLRQGLFCGVPVSIKECYQVRNGTSTLGNMTGNTSHKSDGPLVAKLRAAGSVIHALTNVPQLMIVHETRNPKFGTTNNPWNLARSVGGSSGGEAALIAAGGSFLGLANDLGGSIRLPAHFCGVHGIKPTSRRLPRTGTMPNLRGMTWPEFQPGPIARHVEDLDSAMKIVTRQSPNTNWHAADDPAIGFRPGEQSLDILRIGYFADDGYFSACPAARRAMREAVEGLQDRGATVLPIEPPPMARFLKYYFGILSADGGRDFDRLLGNSVRDPLVARLVRLAKVPRWLRPLLAMLVLKPQGKRKMAELFVASGPRSTDSFWKLCWETITAVEELHRNWETANIDLVLCPTHALPAMLPEICVDLLPAASYSIFANLLGVPCGNVAATRVRENELSDRDASKDHTAKLAQQVEQGSVGLPIGVQVIGRPWREDQVLTCMAELESHFRSLPDYPCISKLEI